MTHMTTRPLHLRITDSSGSTHVEERQTWGNDGPARLHAAIAAQYREEWERQESARKKDDGPPVPRPIVAVISREEYDHERFGGKA